MRFQGLYRRVRLHDVKTNVYVDGFNLYYGAVKRTPHKWLDIRRYCELAFPQNDIAEIHYCTAIVKDASRDPHQSLRQLQDAHGTITKPARWKESPC